MVLTGNKIVDEISQMHLNSIPEAWYKTIRRVSGPHAMAILVLWDLIYWYKWTEIKDEGTGAVVGYKKKFKADLLQRSYSAIAERFGITKRQATDIIDFLSELGAIKKVFRTVIVGEVKCSNVLFIELVPSVIKILSDEHNNVSSEVSQNNVIGVGVPKKRDTYIQENVKSLDEKTSDLYTEKSETNTTTSHINSQSSSHYIYSVEKKVDTSDEKNDLRRSVHKGKHAYGEFKNVWLTDVEYDRLKSEYPSEIDAIIQHFSELKEMKGYVYKNDNLALRKWGIRSYHEQNSRQSFSKNNRGKEGEFTEIYRRSAEEEAEHQKMLSDVEYPF